MKILILLALAVITVLAGIAAYYLLKLRELNQRRKAHEEHQRLALEKGRDEKIKSIQILARAVTQGEVSYTEAAIRISGLMDMLELSDDLRESLSVFSQLADATSHIPYLEAWAKLPTKEKLRLDKEREQIEAKFKEFVDVAVEKVVKTPELFAETSI